MSKVPLHVLPGFVAAARHRNLTRAAASLHLTVSALSHQVRGLERLLERRLFDRGPRGLTLTPAGERLLAAVGPAFDALSAALTPDRPRRPTLLTLSVMPSFATSWLVPRLGAFVAAVRDRLNRVESRLVGSTEDVDAAIRFGADTGPPHPPSFRVDRPGGEPAAPLASPGCRSGNPASLPPLGIGGRWRTGSHAGGDSRRCRRVRRPRDAARGGRRRVAALGG
jgi:LysR family glycine cleavage system transcriptional activator